MRVLKSARPKKIWLEEAGSIPAFRHYSSTAWVCVRIRMHRSVNSAWDERFSACKVTIEPDAGFLSKLPGTHSQRSARRTAALPRYPVRTDRVCKAIGQYTHFPERKSQLNWQDLFLTPHAALDIHFLGSKLPWMQGRSTSHEICKGFTCALVFPSFYFVLFSYLALIAFPSRYPWRGRSLNQPHLLTPHWPRKSDTSLIFCQPPAPIQLFNVDQPPPSLQATLSLALSPAYSVRSTFRLAGTPATPKWVRFPQQPYNPFLSSAYIYCLLIGVVPAFKKINLRYVPSVLVLTFVNQTSVMLIIGGYTYD